MPKNLISIKDLTKKQLEEIFKLADDIKKNGSFSKTLVQKTLVLWFKQPSTRTLIGFEITARRLGFNVINFSPSRSSIEKLESAKDTVLTLEALGVDVVVTRGSQVSQISSLARAYCQNLIIINAGSDTDHPIQALVDAYTAREEFGDNFSALTLVMVGDITNSRVALSNIELFSRLGAKIKTLQVRELKEKERFEPVKNLVKGADIIMPLRLEKRWHKLMKREEYKRAFQINAEVIKNASARAIICAPGPKHNGIEITEDAAEESPQSRIKEQVKNRVPIMMAVLKTLIVD